MRTVEPFKNRVALVEAHRDEISKCTWCFGSGEWAERRQLVPCKKCNGLGVVRLMKED